MAAVQPVDHCRQQRCLSASRGSNDQNQSCFSERKLFDEGRKIKVFDPRYCGRKQAHRAAQTVARPKDVQTNRTEVSSLRGNVGMSALGELRLSAFIKLRLDEGVQLSCIDNVIAASNQLSINAQNRTASNSDVNIGRSAFARSTDDF
jgi:hypothetical protein